MNPHLKNPKLRPVDLRPISYEGERFILFRDPLQLAEGLLLIPEPLGPLVALCDGTRETAGDLAAAAAIRFGFEVDRVTVDKMLSALDEALLLENDRYREACSSALAAYRGAPFRAPALAGSAYPDDPVNLRSMLQSYIDGTGSGGDAPRSGAGIVSPHIDYARGGPVYASVWDSARTIANDADLVVIFGTDHFGGDASITLTRQNYATPFGVLPTSTSVVDYMAARLGEESSFEGELRHAGEHSIELASVWLHHIRGGRPCEIVPILCGSFSRFTCGKRDPRADSRINTLVQSLRSATEGRRVFSVAAADLSHVGPAFGGPPVDFDGRGRLKQFDTRIIDCITRGDADGFFNAIADVGDRTNVCGVSPIYLQLRFHEGLSGRSVAYDSCPADDEASSFVSICGVLFD